MVVLGVARAAAELGVSERRVRQMLADGVIDGERIGRVWAIDAADLRSASQRRLQVGRPWRPASAWAVLALADGRDADLSSVQRSRAKKQLSKGLAQIVSQLSSRADLRRFYAHPSLLDRIAQAPEIVRSGVSATVDHDVDLIVSDQFEGYLRASHLDEMVSHFGLDDEAERPNVTLRVVDDVVWPFREAQAAADRAVVAVDLLESDDPRSQRSGSELVDRR